MLGLHDQVVQCSWYYTTGERHQFWSKRIFLNWVGYGMEAMGGRGRMNWTRNSDCFGGGGVCSQQPTCTDAAARSCSTTTHNPPPLRTDLNLKEAYTGIVQKILVNLYSSTLKVRCTESSLAVPCWTNLCLAVVEIHCLPPKILLWESSQSIEVSRAKRGLPPNNNMPRVLLNNCQLSVSTRGRESRGNEGGALSLRWLALIAWTRIYFVFVETNKYCNKQ